ncbi:hypothetical protein BDN70DRAFT_883059 [Pholiota conissans]|uniref:Uncharacterized protein n=1 Tax=Pholiota conissans TaxID=109636 RepID=A0A9P5YWG5_9AGAR|nr:hypothetical protein BDN70DRAFT_883059 [Pholiota conissans]
MTKSTSTLVDVTHLQMLPTQPPLNGKRKPEDFNPLLNAAAAKRAKKEAKLGAPNKRKLTHDDGGGGLLIVRAPGSQPSQSQPPPAHNTESLPPHSASQPLTETAGPSKPPSKKFKTNPLPPRPVSKSKSATRDRVPYAEAYDEAEVENDVRAMEDEADHLRRKSRANTTINSSLRPSDNNIHFPSRRSEEPANTSRNKGKSKFVDTTAPLPDDEETQQERNKQLRQGAMDAITGNRGRSMETDSSRGHRRKSSVGGRGKRTSTAFETTGVITQPHNSVSESSFYKHIDCDLPDSERVRQLLIWCSLRAAANPPPTSKSPPLPPLSAQGAQIMKILQDDLVRMLAEKRIDLSFHSPEASTSKQPQENLRENEQNVRNRQWEITYSRHIQQAQAEEEAWKKVSYGYDAYAKKLQASLEKRTADLNPQSLSAKAKGKRRATGDLDDIESHFMPQEHELPPEFHPALALAKSALGHRATGDERIPNRRSLSRSNLTRDEMEAELKRRLPSLEYKIDQIFSYASAARATTNIAEKALNERFDIISANLASRTNPFPPTGDASTAGSATQLLSTYVAPKASSVDPLDLMRALSRVDQGRPPALVGDAARRAAREVQRANETGVIAVGDRPLTGVPATPRKTPGTPRRGTTPSRDR